MSQHPNGQNGNRKLAQTINGIPVSAVLNENWRGKSDAAERRRIQNRLNQRAFRQRQRSGEPSKQYKPRSTSEPPEDNDEFDDDESDEGDTPESKSPRVVIEGRPTSRPMTKPSKAAADSNAGRVWDELARIINRNFLSALVANAQHIGMDLSTALRTTTSAYTPRISIQQSAAPAALRPTEAQYQIAHDPIIDAIPHSRLRYNILRAIAQQQLDQAAFSASLRASGALENVNGSWQRGGLVVWSAPEQVSSWELSEPFVRRWDFLLQECEDLISATNVWRGRRGEKLFPLSLSCVSSSPGTERGKTAQWSGAR